VIFSFMVDATAQVITRVMSWVWAGCNAFRCSRRHAASDSRRRLPASGHMRSQPCPFAVAQWRRPIDAGTLMHVRNWTQGITFKAMGVGLLALLMLIPLWQVQDLIGERQGLQNEAQLRIAERWGGRQIVGGPVLIVPVRKAMQSEKGWISTDELRYVLPETLQVKGSLLTEIRRYGIYATPIYTATLGVSGQFRHDALATLANQGGEPQWDRAVLRVPLADVRGIRSLSALRIDGIDALFGPGSGGVGGLSATETAWPIDPHDTGATHGFSFDMRLAGTAALSFLPL